MSAPTTLAASPVELELLRRERRTASADSLALTHSLSEYDAARAALIGADELTLADVIHREHAARGAFGAPSAAYLAAVDIERERRRARADSERPAHRFHTGEPASDDLAGGPATRVSTLAPRPDQAPHRAPLCAALADAAEDRRQRELGAARRNPERYAVWVHTGGAQYDGGALALASHRLTDDGREVESPHYVLVASVVAQPADPRALRLKSTQWRGAAAWSDSVRLADVGHSPRQHTSAATFAVETPDGERDHNGRLNGEPVRWLPLSADGAAWLHAVAGTAWQAPASDSNDGRRIVGAVAVPGAASRTHRWVAVTMSDGGTYVRTRGLDHHGRSTGMDAHAPYVAQSARWVSKRQDLRRNTGDSERGAQVVAATRQRRLVESVALAVEALATGAPVRSNTRTARALRVAAAVALMAGTDIGTALASASG